MMPRVVATTLAVVLLAIVYKSTFHEAKRQLPNAEHLQAFDGDGLEKSVELQVGTGISVIIDNG